MKTITLMFALASASLTGFAISAAASAPARAAQASTAAPVSTTMSEEFGARKKVRRHHHVHRGHRSAYGYEQPYRQGYYRGVQPGWGYGPDPGDRAWPPFHFKPYW